MRKRLCQHRLDLSDLSFECRDAAVAIYLTRRVDGLTGRDAGNGAPRPAQGFFDAAGDRGALVDDALLQVQHRRMRHLGFDGERDLVEPEFGTAGTHGITYRVCPVPHVPNVTWRRDGVNCLTLSVLAPGAPRPARVGAGSKWVGSTATLSTGKRTAPRSNVGHVTDANGPLTTT